MLVALFNNLPELILSAAWTGLVFWQGMRFARMGWAAFIPFLKSRS